MLETFLHNLVQLNQPLSCWMDTLVQTSTPLFSVVQNLNVTICEVRGNYFAFPYVTLQPLLSSAHSNPQAPLFPGQVAVWTIFNTACLIICCDDDDKCGLNANSARIAQFAFPAIVPVALLRTFFPSPLHFPCTFPFHRSLQHFFFVENSFSFIASNAFLSEVTDLR